MKCEAKTEQEMLQAKVPTPQSQEELSTYINSLIDRTHDYGTCVYAMSMAAVATFNFVASRLGVTGFQASCADLDIIRRTRSMNCPFILLKAEDMLYPQYDLHQKLGEAMQGWKGWVSEHAQQKLTELDYAHPDVVAHWVKLAEQSQEDEV